ncbi:MAG: putative bifunctional diguanylate cyclase/phosphodiesterase [Tepidiformaceae bacterium]
MSFREWLRIPRLPIRLLVSAVLCSAVVSCFLALRTIAGDGYSPLALGSALVAIVSTGAITLAAVRLKRSLADLGIALEQVGSGEMALRLPGSHVREIHYLAHSFNLMASSLQESTERLEHQAFHDPLTGLPNRAMFMASFSRSLAAAQACGGRVAVLFLDMDRFKVLNDSLGHGVGDQLLAALSQRLVAATRGHLVARLGGDEFTVLVDADDPETVAAVIAERVLDSCRMPFSVAGHEIFASVSIGFAVSCETDRTITDLLRKADIALYRAKSEGRGRAVVFRRDLDELSAEQFDLDNALRRSVERGELMLQYQPIVDLRTGQIVATEALLRWNHPHRGVLSPSMFVAVAEETGEIIRIGQWVLEEACREAVRFQAMRPAVPLSMSVNISAAEFRQPGLAARIERVLDDTGLVPRNLKLELTESVLLGDVPQTMEILNELKGLGVCLSIDDFGTGYSSLSYLQRLPVDVLKVDQSFVASLGSEATSGPVVRAVIDLANALFMQVIAEGIETREQLDFLRSIGCPLGQGFYFHRALDPADFEGVLLQEQLSHAILESAS